MSVEIDSLDVEVELPDVGEKGAGLAVAATRGCSVTIRGLRVKIELPDGVVGPGASDASRRTSVLAWLHNRASTIARAARTDCLNAVDACVSGIKGFRAAKVAVLRMAKSVMGGKPGSSGPAKLLVRLLASTSVSIRDMELELSGPAPVRVTVASLELCGPLRSFGSPASDPAGGAGAEPEDGGRTAAAEDGSAAADEAASGAALLPDEWPEAAAPSAWAEALPHAGPRLRASGFAVSTTAAGPEAGIVAAASASGAGGRATSRRRAQAARQSAGAASHPGPAGHDGAEQAAAGAGPAQLLALDAASLASWHGDAAESADGATAPPKVSLGVSAGLGAVAFPAGAGNTVVSLAQEWDGAFSAAAGCTYAWRRLCSWFGGPQRGRTTGPQRLAESLAHATGGGPAGAPRMDEVSLWRQEAGWNASCRLAWMWGVADPRSAAYRGLRLPPPPGADGPGPDDAAAALKPSEALAADLRRLDDDSEGLADAVDLRARALLMSATLSSRMPVPQPAFLARHRSGAASASAEAAATPVSRPGEPVADVDSAVLVDVSNALFGRLLLRRRLLGLAKARRQFGDAAPSDARVALAVLSNAEPELRRLRGSLASLTMGEQGADGATGATSQEFVTRVERLTAEAEVTTGEPTVRVGLGSVLALAAIVDRRGRRALVPTAAVLSVWGGAAARAVTDGWSGLAPRLATEAEDAASLAVRWTRGATGRREVEVVARVGLLAMLASDATRISAAVAAMRWVRPALVVLRHRAQGLERRLSHAWRHAKPEDAEGFVPRVRLSLRAERAVAAWSSDEGWHSAAGEALRSSPGRRTDSGAAPRGSRSVPAFRRALVSVSEAVEWQVSLDPGDCPAADRGEAGTGRARGGALWTLGQTSSAVHGRAASLAGAVRAAARLDRSAAPVDPLDRESDGVPIEARFGMTASIGEVRLSSALGGPCTVLEAALAGDPTLAGRERLRIVAWSSPTVSVDARGGTFLDDGTTAGSRAQSLAVHVGVRAPILRVCVPAVMTSSVASALAQTVVVAEQAAYVVSSRWGELAADLSGAAGSSNSGDAEGMPSSATDGHVPPRIAVGLHAELEGVDFVFPHQFAACEARRTPRGGDWMEGAIRVDESGQLNGSMDAVERAWTGGAGSTSFPLPLARGEVPRAYSDDDDDGSLGTRVCGRVSAGRSVLVAAIGGRWAALSLVAFDVTAREVTTTLAAGPPADQAHAAATAAAGGTAGELAAEMARTRCADLVLGGSGALGLLAVTGRGSHKRVFASATGASRAIEVSGGRSIDEIEPLVLPGDGGAARAGSPSQRDVLIAPAAVGIAGVLAPQDAPQTVPEPLEGLVGLACQEAELLATEDMEGTSAGVTASPDQQAPDARDEGRASRGDDADPSAAGLATADGEAEAQAAAASHIAAWLAFACGRPAEAPPGAGIVSRDVLGGENSGQSEERAPEQPPRLAVRFWTDRLDARLSRDDVTVLVGLVLTTACRLVSNWVRLSRNLQASLEAAEAASAAVAARRKSGYIRPSEFVREVVTVVIAALRQEDGSVPAPHVAGHIGRSSLTIHSSGGSQRPPALRLSLRQVSGSSAGGRAELRARVSADFVNPASNQWEPAMADTTLSAVLARAGSDPGDGSPANPSGAEPRPLTVTAHGPVVLHVSPSLLMQLTVVLGGLTQLQAALSPVLRDAPETLQSVIRLWATVGAAGKAIQSVRRGADEASGAKAAIADAHRLGDDTRARLARLSSVIAEQLATARDRYRLLDVVNATSSTATIRLVLQGDARDEDSLGRDAERGSFLTRQAASEEEAQADSPGGAAGQARLRAESEAAPRRAEAAPPTAAPGSSVKVFRPNDREASDAAPRTAQAALVPAARRATATLTPALLWAGGWASSRFARPPGGLWSAATQRYRVRAVLRLRPDEGERRGKEFAADLLSDQERPTGTRAMRGGQAPATVVYRTSREGGANVALISPPVLIHNMTSSPIEFAALPREDWAGRVAGGRLGEGAPASASVVVPPGGCAGLPIGATSNHLLSLRPSSERKAFAFASIALDRTGWAAKALREVFGAASASGQPEWEAPGAESDDARVALADAASASGSATAWVASRPTAWEEAEPAAGTSLRPAERDGRPSTSSPLVTCDVPMIGPMAPRASLRRLSRVRAARVDKPYPVEGFRPRHRMLALGKHLPSVAALGPVTPGPAPRGCIPMRVRRRHLPPGAAEAVGIDYVAASLPAASLTRRGCRALASTGARVFLLRALPWARGAGVVIEVRPAASVVNACPVPVEIGTTAPYGTAMPRILTGAACATGSALAPAEALLGRASGLPTRADSAGVPKPRPAAIGAPGAAASDEMQRLGVPFGHPLARGAVATPSASAVGSGAPMPYVGDDGGSSVLLFAHDALPADTLNPWLGKAILQTASADSAPPAAPAAPGGAHGDAVTALMSSVRTFAPADAAAAAAQIATLAAAGRGAGAGEASSWPVRSCRWSLPASLQPSCVFSSAHASAFGGRGGAMVLPGSAAGGPDERAAGSPLQHELAVGGGAAGASGLSRVVVLEPGESVQLLGALDDPRRLSSRDAERLGLAGGWWWSDVPKPFRRPKSRGSDPGSEWFRALGEAAGELEAAEPATEEGSDPSDSSDDDDDGVGGRRPTAASDASSALGAASPGGGSSGGRAAAERKDGTQRPGHRSTGSTAASAGQMVKGMFGAFISAVSGKAGDDRTAVEPTRPPAPGTLWPGACMGSWRLRVRLPGARWSGVMPGAVLAPEGASSRLAGDTSDPSHPNSDSAIVVVDGAMRSTVVRASRGPCRAEAAGDITPVEWHTLFRGSRSFPEDDEVSPGEAMVRGLLRRASAAARGDAAGSGHDPLAVADAERALGREPGQAASLSHGWVAVVSLDTVGVDAVGVAMSPPLAREELEASLAAVARAAAAAGALPLELREARLSPGRALPEAPPVAAGSLTEGMSVVDVVRDRVKAAPSTPFGSLLGSFRASSEALAPSAAWAARRTVLTAGLPAGLTSAELVALLQRAGVGGTEGCVGTARAGAYAASPGGGPASGVAAAGSEMWRNAPLRPGWPPGWSRQRLHDGAPALDPDGPDAGEPSERSVLVRLQSLPPAALGGMPLPGAVDLLGCEPPGRIGSGRSSLHRFLSPQPLAGLAVAISLRPGPGVGSGGVWGPLLRLADGSGTSDRDLSPAAVRRGVSVQTLVKLPSPDPAAPSGGKVVVVSVVRLAGGAETLRSDGDDASGGIGWESLRRAQDAIQGRTLPSHSVVVSPAVCLSSALRFSLQVCPLDDETGLRADQQLDLPADPTTAAVPLWRPGTSVSAPGRQRFGTVAVRLHGESAWSGPIRLDVPAADAETSAAVVVPAPSLRVGNGGGWVPITVTLSRQQPSGSLLAHFSGSAPGTGDLRGGATPSPSPAMAASADDEADAPVLGDADELLSLGSGSQELVVVNGCDDVVVLVRQPPNDGAAQDAWAWTQGSLFDTGPTAASSGVAPPVPSEAAWYHAKRRALPLQPRSRRSAGYYSPPFEGLVPSAAGSGSSSPPATGLDVAVVRPASTARAAAPDDVRLLPAAALRVSAWRRVQLEAVTGDGEDNAVELPGSDSGGPERFSIRTTHAGGSTIVTVERIAGLLDPHSPGLDAEDDPSPQQSDAVSPGSGWGGSGTDDPDAPQSGAVDLALASAARLRDVSVLVPRLEVTLSGGDGSNGSEKAAVFVDGAAVEARGMPGGTRVAELTVRRVQVDAFARVTGHGAADAARAGLSRPHVLLARQPHRSVAADQAPHLRLRVESAGVRDRVLRLLSADLAVAPTAIVARAETAVPLLQAAASIGLAMRLAREQVRRGAGEAVEGSDGREPAGDDAGASRAAAPPALNLLLSLTGGESRDGAARGHRHRPSGSSGAPVQWGGSRISVDRLSLAACHLELDARVSSAFLLMVEQARGKPLSPWLRTAAAALTDVRGARLVLPLLLTHCSRLRPRDLAHLLSRHAEASARRQTLSLLAGASGIRGVIGIYEATRDGLATAHALVTGADDDGTAVSGVEGRGYAGGGGAESPVSDAAGSPRAAASAPWSRWGVASSPGGAAGSAGGPSPRRSMHLAGRIGLAGVATVSGVITGLSGAVSDVTSMTSRALLGLAGDDEDALLAGEAEDEWQSRTSAPLQAMANGMWSGVSRPVQDVREGWRRHGVLGAGRGLTSAALGVVTRPAAGVLLGTSLMMRRFGNQARRLPHVLAGRAAAARAAASGQAGLDLPAIEDPGAAIALVREMPTRLAARVKAQLSGAGEAGSGGDDPAGGESPGHTDGAEAAERCVLMAATGFLRLPSPELAGRAVLFVKQAELEGEADAGLGRGDLERDLLAGRAAAAWAASLAGMAAHATRAGALEQATALVARVCVAQASPLSSDPADDDSPARPRRPARLPWGRASTLMTRTPWSDAAVRVAAALHSGPGVPLPGSPAVRFRPGERLVFHTVVPEPWLAGNPADRDGDAAGTTAVRLLSSFSELFGSRSGEAAAAAAVVPAVVPERARSAAKAPSVSRVGVLATTTQRVMMLTLSQRPEAGVPGSVGGHWAEWAVEATWCLDPGWHVGLLGSVGAMTAADDRLALVSGLESEGRSGAAGRSPADGAGGSAASLTRIVLGSASLLSQCLPPAAADPLPAHAWGFRLGLSGFALSEATAWAVFPQVLAAAEGVVEAVAGAEVVRRKALFRDAEGAAAAAAVVGRAPVLPGDGTESSPDDGPAPPRPDPAAALAAAYSEACALLGPAGAPATARGAASSPPELTTRTRQSSLHRLAAVLAILDTVSPNSPKLWVCAANTDWEASGVLGVLAGISAGADPRETLARIVAASQLLRAAWRGPLFGEERGLAWAVAFLLAMPSGGVGVALSLLAGLMRAQEDDHGTAAPAPILDCVAGLKLALAAIGGWGSQ